MKLSSLYQYPEYTRRNLQTRNLKVRYESMILKIKDKDQLYIQIIRAKRKKS